MKATVQKVLLRLHGRAESNLEVRYGNQIVKLMSFSEILDIFKKEATGHHKKAQQNDERKCKFLFCSC